MNPTLPLLALLTGAGAAGLARAGREGLRDLALPWALAGLAGMALLAPALSLPDGIPSPAATLAQLPPWLGTGSPAEGNPLLRDVTFQIEPWLLFLRREFDGRWHELRAGAALRFVGLGDGSDDVEAFAGQGAERGNREFGSAEEEHAH